MHLLIGQISPICPIGAQFLGMIVIDGIPYTPHEVNGIEWLESCILHNALKSAR
jgi:hypothetical protein